MKESALKILPSQLKIEKKKNRNPKERKKKKTLANNSKSGDDFALEIILIQE